MRLGILFTPRGARPYASYSLRSGHSQHLTPGESVAFAVIFLLTIMVSAVIVVVVF